MTMNAALRTTFMWYQHLDYEIQMLFFQSMDVAPQMGSGQALKESDHNFPDIRAESKQNLFPRTQYSQFCTWLF